jgi:hypothetical protein
MKQLILAFLLPLAVTAMAQPAPPITPNSACGAEATGYRGVKSGGTLRPITQAVPGQQVGPNGHWKPCKMPMACAARQSVEITVPSGSSPYVLRGNGLKASQLGTQRTVVFLKSGKWYGTEQHKCVSTGWVLVGPAITDR